MWPTIKKYGKYIAIALVAIALVVLYVMVKSWLKPKPKEGMTEGTEQLKDVINEIGQRFTEANHQAAIEIAVGRQEEAGLKQELAEVVKIQDKTERRKRLADLYNKVS